jgi:hypothetical protein
MKKKSTKNVPVLLASHAMPSSLLLLLLLFSHPLAPNRQMIP